MEILYLEYIQFVIHSKNGCLLCNGLTFLILYTASYLSIRFVFYAGLPVYYGQAGLQNYLSDYVRISVPLGALWMTTLIWIVTRRSPNYLGLVAIGLLTALAFGSMIWIPYQEMPLLALVGGALTGIIVMLLTRMVIKILGFCEKQIVCVKPKKWDWSKAASGIVIGIVFTFIISVVSDVTRAMFLEGMEFGPAVQKMFSLNTVVWWNWGLPSLLSMSTFFFLVLGLGWGEVVLRRKVDLPNQGIKDSGRNGIIVAAGGIE